MRVTCPNCAAAYDLPGTVTSRLDGARTVRCARCGTTWAPAVGADALSAGAAGPPSGGALRGLVGTSSDIPSDGPFGTAPVPASSSTAPPAPFDRAGPPQPDQTAPIPATSPSAISPSAISPSAVSMPTGAAGAGPGPRPAPTDAMAIPPTPSGARPEARSQVPSPASPDRAGRGMTLAWLLSFLILGGAVWAAWQWRGEVMAAWPPSIRLYAAVNAALGLPGPP